jgi:hypothetical protein
MQAENEKLQNVLRAAEDLGETLKLENEELRSKVIDETNMKEEYQEQLRDSQELISSLRIELD